MPNKSLTKPVYKRQQFLLAFLHEIKGGCSATDLQKLIFLYTHDNGVSFYDFVPYKYGSYSFQLAQDIDTLHSIGWLEHIGTNISYTGYDSNSLFGYSASQFKSIDNLRGNKLIKKVYIQHPYYAINSIKATALLNDNEMKTVRNTHAQLKQDGQVLFTIGYEGLSVETYINTLIQNDVHLLCDVRNNPLSRKFGFSKSNLGYFLQNVGIEYVHIPELGIISGKRKSLETKEDYDVLFGEYSETLSAKKRYLDDVHTLMQTKKRIALTCFEHDPQFCHRHVIRDNLVKEHHLNHKDL
ncbi:hypothetical protein FACS189476_06530 [Spirochaetia bacterium]|nr:hypothetical protein FACS189476_06530 [Spirochaetia bacterium]